MRASEESANQLRSSPKAGHRAAGEPVGGRCDAPVPLPPGWRRGGISDTVDLKRAARLRSKLVAGSQAPLSRVEAFLDACGWERRTTKSGHRAWTKPGKRTLIVPVHGSKIAPAIVRAVLDANTDVEEG